MTNIIILDELTMMSAEVRDAIASLTAAIVREKNSEIHDITGIPVPHNWGEIQGYGHKKEAMTFIETLATELDIEEEEDDGNPHCYQEDRKSTRLNSSHT